MREIRIEALEHTDRNRSALGEILREVVASGGSVGFMHPVSAGAAESFWDRSLASAARGERVVFGAFDGDALVGTVSLVLDCPPNQAHRADIAKMMTRVASRGRGVASALVREAERVAVDRGKTLLVLDTASDEGASAFYEKLGYALAGEIPDYALKPLGGLTGTKLYWKRIGAWAEGRPG